MRLRVRELLEQRNMTPYSLAKSSRGRISLSAAYRLAQADGRFKTIHARTLEALCDVFGVSAGELFDDRARR
ncbi:MAG TPA: helix-turn-helix transcriptional regulator [Gemmatimonadales bacterium]|nr:helix-turn-helix transcriptional regulator [Gemmatimonadales bacterium]